VYVCLYSFPIISERSMMIHVLVAMLFPTGLSRFNKTGKVHMNVTSRRVHATIAAVEKHKVLYILRVCL